MSEYVFTPPPVTSLAIAGDARRFPVRRIFCAGRNYADHIIEMGGAPDAAPPVIFTKPPDALVCDGADVSYPRATRELHHEIELVLTLNIQGAKPLRDADEVQAAQAIFGIAAGVDLTRRDMQAAAKKAGAPWAAAKGFAASAPIGAITPLAAPPGPVQGPISLAVNGQIRQDGDLAQMLWQPARLLSYISTLFDLHSGDLVFTGTPAGVGPLRRGDQVQGKVAGTAGVAFKVV